MEEVDITFRTDDIDIQVERVSALAGPSPSPSLLDLAEASADQWAAVRRDAAHSSLLRS